ncbi:hypothetical protein JNUCC1_01771 [Lentibacillus sp. JNUCC-1]|uniref:hypothetical protein n=1 Tax=Lentibacillus sp. JNUCC-1 TaxID=2654513 RepID=UPI0012E94712|nr:hypothetical protein [Lentibacillus sp. JNUCC-1]MUV37965.1 hypothetical protein [Lentibacillus sp. JNUCC-1]
MSLIGVIILASIAVILLVVGFVIKKKWLKLFALILFSISIWQFGSYLIQHVIDR